MKLSGSWRASILTEDNNRSVIDPSFNDEVWEKVQVPHRWNDYQNLKDNTKPVIYRKNITLNNPKKNRRYWITFEGITETSEVWLDGELLGETYGHGLEHKFEITDQIQHANNHILVLEVACGEKSSPKNNLSGSFQSGIDHPIKSVGGITAPVVITNTGDVAIKYSRLICSEANSNKAKLIIRTVLNSNISQTISVAISVKHQNIQITKLDILQPIAIGENQIEWNVEIEEPKLWWPYQLGEQPIYDIKLELNNNGEVSDTKTWQTGIRQIKMEQMALSINGEKIFIKGVALNPTLSLNPEHFTDDIKHIKECGLNMARVYAHISNKQLYSSADEEGILIWQDMPLVGRYSRRIKQQAKKIVRGVVDQLVHHPSIYLWNIHCEPSETYNQYTHDQKLNQLIGSSFKPSWNKNNLDPTLKKELSNADKSRPIMQNSDILPNPWELNLSTTNLSLGWRYGVFDDLNKLHKLWPKASEFIAGIGSYTVNPKSDFENNENDKNIKPIEKSRLKKYLKIESINKNSALMSEQYQAELIRNQIEKSRTMRFNPTGGFCVMDFQDTNSGGGYGILRSDGSKKISYQKLIETCVPILLIAEKNNNKSKNKVIIKFYVVNDSLAKYKNIELVSEINSGNFSKKTSWHGNIKPNSINSPATQEVEFPEDTKNFSLNIFLQDKDSEERITQNSYQFDV